MRANQLVKCAGIITTTFCIFLLCFQFTFSQGNAGNTAAPFLVISPSPEAAGIGGSGAVLPTDDPFAFFFNPAQLGFAARNNNYISFALNPIGIDFSPYNNEMGYSNFAISGGYDVSKYFGIPLKIGVGYLHQYFSYGDWTLVAVNGDTLGQYNAHQSASTMSVGFCFDYFIKISGGISYKLVYSLMNPPIIYNPYSGEGSADAFDVGLFAEFPILNSHPVSDNLAVNLNTSAGYTFANWGSAMIYHQNGVDIGDPIPREARIGLGISTGLDMRYYDKMIPAIKIDIVSEANNILVERTISGHSYKPVLGDINIWDNVFMMKSLPDKGNNLRGIQIALFDIAVFRFGGFDDFMNISYTINSDTTIKLTYKTSGFTIKAKGIFNILKPLLKNDIIDYIADHFDFGYSYAFIPGAEYFDVSNMHQKLYDQHYKSIFLRFKGFEI